MSCLPTDANIAATTLSYDSYTEYQKGLYLANERLAALGYSSDDATSYDSLNSIM